MCGSVIHNFFPTSFCLTKHWLRRGKKDLCLHRGPLKSTVDPWLNELCANDWQGLAIKKIAVPSNVNLCKLMKRRNAKTSRHFKSWFTWVNLKTNPQGKACWYYIFNEYNVVFFYALHTCWWLLKKQSTAHLGRKAIFWSLETWQSQTNSSRQHVAENTSVHVWLRDKTSVCF